MQTNDHLTKTFPKLPEGYRWKVEASRYPSIIGISLQKKGIFFWKTICYGAGSTAFGPNDHLAPLTKAKEMFKTRFDPDNLIGVTDR